MFGSVLKCASPSLVTVRGGQVAVITYNQSFADKTHIPGHRSAYLSQTQQTDAQSRGDDAPLTALSGKSQALPPVDQTVDSKRTSSIHTLALKPIYLSPTSQDSASPKPSAALRGATTAFVPRISTPVISPSPVSAGARSAAFAAGTSTRYQAQRVATQGPNEGKEKSPTRGRHLTVNNNAALGAARSSSSSNTTSNPVRPPLQARSSSTLAARYASVYSPSPQRSPNRSPSRNDRLTIRAEEHARNAQSAHALSGAMASMAATLVRGQQHDHSVIPSKTPALDLKKVPLISHTEPTRGLNGTTGPTTPSTTTHGRKIDEQQRDHPVSRSNDSLAPAQMAAQAEPIQTIMPRQVSEESVATIATSAAAKAEEGRGRPEFKRPALPAKRPSSTFLRSITQGSRRHSDDYWAGMTVNALADAMVASSLASSRAVSPQKSPPPVSRRRSQSTAALYDLKSRSEVPGRRKPLKPPRAMKHTLRKQSSSGDEEVELTKRGRRHWMRKHPNKHSEGDRKRWRDKVTELERKRYEGVFAANRGLLIGSGYFEPTAATLSDNTAVGNQVVNIVVRDIWERSRLPREVLKEIYDLVSPEEAHELNREQFVVGMWLVDQRLKGRKLPVKVSASVWASVRHSHGIKIRSHHS